ncbi:hypothetical protein ACA910_020251 [Epithemia clementina (nom. ined.)]
MLLPTFHVLVSLCLRSILLFHSIFPIAASAHVNDPSPSSNRKVASAEQPIRREQQNEPKIIVEDEDGYRPGCVLGACSVEWSFALDHVIAESEWKCQDLRSDCEEHRDDCNRPGTVTSAECFKTCGHCGSRIRSLAILDPENQDKLINHHIPRGDVSKVKMADGVNSDYGVWQRVVYTEDVHRSATLQRARQVAAYMDELALAEQQGRAQHIQQCRNLNHDCLYWAVLGECDSNPKFMLVNCGPACMHCFHSLSDTVTVV